MSLPIREVLRPNSGRAATQGAEGHLHLAGPPWLHIPWPRVGSRRGLACMMSATRLAPDDMHPPQDARGMQGGRGRSSSESMGCSAARLRPKPLKSDNSRVAGRPSLSASAPCRHRVGPIASLGSVWLLVEISGRAARSGAEASDEPSQVRPRTMDGHVLVRCPSVFL